MSPMFESVRGAFRSLQRRLHDTVLVHIVREAGGHNTEPDVIGHSPNHMCPRITTNVCSLSVPLCTSTGRLIELVRAHDTAGILSASGSVERFWRIQPENTTPEHFPELLTLGANLSFVVPPGVSEITLLCESHSHIVLDDFEDILTHESIASQNEDILAPYLSEYDREERQELNLAVHWRRFRHCAMYVRPSSVRGSTRKWIRVESAPPRGSCARVVELSLAKAPPRRATPGQTFASFEELAEASVGASMGRHSMLQNNCQNFIVDILKRVKANDLLSQLKFSLRSIGLQTEKRHLRAKAAVV